MSTTTAIPDPDRNRHVRALFDRAADLPPAEWVPFLERECPEDAGIRGEVLRLLRGGQRASADRFLVPPCGPPEADPARIGKYRVVRRFAEKSGQAAAYLAFDPDLARHVVLKQYKAWDTDEDRRVMAEEGRALARVRSPFVAQCFGIETHDDAAFLVVEYVPGRNLAEVRRDGPLEATRVVAILRHLAEGVAAVHACGLIHRDLKPANVILGDDDRPRLVDFGLAAPLGSDRLRELCGSPSYMAPEQARGEVERIDYRTDVFGLGAVLYELLAGHPPYEGGTQEAALDRASKADFAPLGRLVPETPAWLEGVCLRALAKAPENRFATALELAEALRRRAEGPHPGGDRASAVPQDRGRRPSRTPLAAAAAAGLLALVLALLARDRPSRPGPLTQPLPPKTKPSGSLGPEDVAVHSKDLDQSPASKITPPDPLRAEVVVDHFEDLGDGKHVRPLGEISAPSVSDAPPRLEDLVRVRVQLTRPAWFYLIALNPDGKDQLCVPADDSARPERGQDVDYPADRADYFPLTDGTGLQAFVVVASDQPLPAYEEWKAQFPGGLTWARVPHGGVRAYDSTAAPANRLRGPPVTREADPLASLCERLRRQPDVTLVHAFAFPVGPR